jgi:thymidylate kinase
MSKRCPETAQEAYDRVIARKKRTDLEAKEERDRHERHIKSYQKILQQNPRDHAAKEISKLFLLSSSDASRQWGLMN